MGDDLNRVAFGCFKINTIVILDRDNPGVGMNGEESIIRSITQRIGDGVIGGIFVDCICCDVNLCTRCRSFGDDAIKQSIVDFDGFSLTISRIEEFDVVLINISNLNLNVTPLAKWDGLTIRIELIPRTTAVSYFNGEIENPVSVLL